MLDGEEKKDSGEPLYYTPDPLAMEHGESPSSAQDAKVADPRYGQHPSQPAAAASAAAGRTPAGVPDPIGVPTAMLGSSEPLPSSSGASIGLPFDASPIQVTQTMSDPQIASPTSVPSPLASPILTVGEFADAAYRPPSRPGSVLSADANAMDAMASAIHASGTGAEEMEPPARRRRANTIHGAGSTSSPGSLQAGESLQPVNFGGGRVPQFSPGTGARKLSNASVSSSPSMGSPSMGLRSASSGSLYSEYSHDSASAGGSPPYQPAPPKSAGRPMGTAAPAGTPQFTAPPGKIAGPNPRPPPTNSADKRQKRLERNRESARASRRRRKAYLEELEARVSSLSDEMDRGRMGHAFGAVRTIRGMRIGRLRELERAVEGGEGAPPVAAGAAGGTKPTKSGGIAHAVQSVPTPPSPHYRRPNAMPLPLEQQTRLLTGSLSRTSDELQIVQTFLTQQLRSLVQPASSRFVLWLSLQKDGFYRGGRSASERLSAARIGERMLHGGTYRASPFNGMWPLVCHEVGLSYDQEERIRHTQQTVLKNALTWVHRHTALATQSVIQSVHATMGGAQQAAKRREGGLMDVLSPEQRVKFLAWAGKRQEAIRRLAGARFGQGAAGSEGGEYPTSPHRHVAANLYIMDHRLSKVKQRMPPHSNFVPSSKLKKLGRRPSFESLAGRESEGHSKLSRETSFPSTGSLKRSLNDMAVGGDHDASGMTTSGHNNVTPESAQAAAQSTVMAVLKEVLPLVPKSALQYSQNPHYAAYPPPVMASRPGRGVPSQPQYQSAGVGRPKGPRPQRSNMPMTTQQQPAAAYAEVPGVDDIPMPTPVSVLMQTADDFMSPEVPYDQQLHEPLDAEAPSNPFAADDAIGGEFVVPDPVSSYAPEHATTSAPFSGRSLLSNRHQSAPQLARGTPSPTDFSYPSLLPAPMAMIPETNNPLAMGAGAEIAGNFGLEELPEIGVDEWAIGEGFDMEVDQGAA